MRNIRCSDRQERGVSQHVLCREGCVSRHALGRGLYPSMHWAGGVYPSMHWAGGCLPGGVSAKGGVYPGGVCPGGDCHTHPVDRMTDDCENITFSATTLRTVITKCNSKSLKKMSVLVPSPCCVLVLSKQKYEWAWLLWLNDNIKSFYTLSCCPMSKCPPV